MGKEICTSYAPTVFKELRRLYNIDPGSYKVCGIRVYFRFQLDESVDINSIPQQSISTGDIEGKKNPAMSGALLFFTKNKLYMLKTMRDHELQFFTATILKKYLHHFQRVKNSLLTQYMGAYRCKNQLLVVMRNVKNAVDTNETFDLKGSSFNRRVSECGNCVKYFRH